MKGVHVRAAHRKEKEERRKEKEDEMGMSLEEGYGGLRTPQMETDEDAEDDSRGATPSPTPNTTPVQQKHQQQQGNKGWSTMLDGEHERPSRPARMSSRQIGSADLWAERTRMDYLGQHHPRPNHPCFPPPPPLRFLLRSMDF